MLGPLRVRDCSEMKRKAIQSHGGHLPVCFHLLPNMGIAKLWDWPKAVCNPTGLPEGALPVCRRLRMWPGLEQ